MKWRRSLILAVTCLLCGILIASHAFAHIQGNIVTQQEVELRNTARSVDRSITGFFQLWEGSLKNLAEHAHIVEAEDSGHTDLLQQYLQESNLAAEETVHALLVIQEDYVLLSTDSSRRYQIAANTEDPVLCHDEAGNIYLLVLYRSRALSYAAVIDPAALCQYLINISAMEEDDELLLIDSTGAICIHYKNGNTQSSLLSPEASDEIFSVALQGQNQDPIQIRMSGSGKGINRSITGYALVRDLGSHNLRFTFCIGSTYDDYFATLYLEMALLTISFAVIFLGIALMIRNTLSLSQKNREAAMELQQLKQRQQALEKINQQTQLLAHHQRLETIGTLTSSISHEFNNLLTPIMSYSLLTLEKLPAEEEELYDNILEIYNASQKAKVIISRLSDLSRKNSPNTFRDASVDALVQKALDIALPAKPRDVEMKLNLNCSYLRIRANEIQICQMLLNLILNAFQAMPETGILEISTTFDDNYVHLHITDNGCGIAPEDQKKIFEPFFTTKDPGKGTGLGLAIVAQVLEDHNGHIDMNSSPGAGTRFHIRLPRQRGPDPS